MEYRSWFNWFLTAQNMYLFWTRQLFHFLPPAYSLLMNINYFYWLLLLLSWPRIYYPLRGSNFADWFTFATTTNSFFETSLSQFLCILLTFEVLSERDLLKSASRVSSYLCSIENSPWVSFMKIGWFHCNLWRTKASVNSELFFTIIEAIGQNSLLRSAFTIILLATEDAEPFEIARDENS